MAQHRSKEHALVSSSRPIRIFVNIRHVDCKLHLALAYLPEAFPGPAGSEAIHIGGGDRGALHWAMNFLRSVLRFIVFTT